MSRKWPTTPEWVRIRKELADVRKSLRRAIDEAEGVRFTTEQRELMAPSLRHVKELLAQWDASLGEAEHDHD